MKEQILTELRNIEKNHDVKILYACESGSRAWGFPSADSDYDVRFLYIHPTEWYLSVDLERRRDVIELPINDELDISGWDLRKALNLYYKSNPPLFEWLGSPIVYSEQFTIAQQMRDLAADFYNPLACMHRYWRMSHSTGDYLVGEQIQLKKFFYTLRAILAINWLEQGLGVVPTEFSILADRIITSTPIRQQIDQLIAHKATGHEKDYSEQLPELCAFVDSEIGRLEKETFTAEVKKQTIAPLNDLFRTALVEVWRD